MSDSIGLVSKHTLFFGLALAFLSVRCADAQDAKPIAEAEKPKTASIVIGPIQSEVSFQANFVPAESTEISVDFRVLPSIKVEEAVPHGASVKAGDPLIRFDTESLIEQIESQERLVATMRLALEESERDAKLAQLQVPLDREQAELHKRQADEDFKYYLEFDQALAEKSNEQSLKSSKDYLDYTAEELRQLEKMYKADDLTEESEEIVLRRAQDDLNRQKFGFEMAEQNYRRTKELSLPRANRDHKITHRLAEIAWERFELTYPLTLERREQSLAKSKHELKEAIKRLEELQGDLKACNVKSPRSGVVYYGRMQSGKWTGAAEVKPRLKKHGTVNSHEVLMTVVDPNSVRLVGNVAEADIANLRAGNAGKATPTAHKNRRIDVVLQSVSAIPVDDGQFEAVVELKNASKELVAGMTASVRFITFFNARALTLPTNAVFKDEQDDSIRFVYVLSSDSKSVRKQVEVGVTEGDRIEIVSGIDASEAVLAEKPKSE